MLKLLTGTRALAGMPNAGARVPRATLTWHSLSGRRGKEELRLRFVIRISIINLYININMSKEKRSREGEDSVC